VLIGLSYLIFHDCLFKSWSNHCLRPWLLAPAPDSSPVRGLHDTLVLRLFSLLYESFILSAVRNCGESIRARYWRSSSRLLRAVGWDCVIGSEGAVWSRADSSPADSWEQPLCASLKHCGGMGRNKRRRRSNSDVVLFWRSWGGVCGCLRLYPALVGLPTNSIFHSLETVFLSLSYCELIPHPPHTLRSISANVHQYLLEVSGAHECWNHLDVAALHSADHNWILSPSGARSGEFLLANSSSLATSKTLSSAHWPLGRRLEKDVVCDSLATFTGAGGQCWDCPAVPNEASGTRAVTTTSCKHARYHLQMTRRAVLMAPA